MIKPFIVFFAVTLLATSAFAQEPTPQPTPPSTQPATPEPAEPEKPEAEKPEEETEEEAEEEKPQPEPEAVVVTETKVEMSEYVLAIDPSLIPENLMQTSGAPISKHRKVPSIGQKRKLTLVEGLAWIPRVVFFPVFLVLEYGVRWPLETATVWVEKNHVITRVQRALSFDDGNGRIVPRLKILSGFSPSFGLGIAWDNMIFEGNDWGIGADIGPNRNLTVDVGTRLRLFEDAVKFGLDYQLERRNDFVFYGIGSTTFEEDETRFFRSKQTGVASVDIERTPSGFGAKTSVEISDYSFDCSDGERDLCGDDGVANTSDDALPIDSDVANAANFFTDGYTLLRLKGIVYYDSREPRPASGTGIRLEAFGRVGQGLDPEEIDFVRYGGEAAAFWDFYRQRVLGLRARVELADPIGDGQIPFGELITLGGRETMRGFGTARFHGRSAFVATLDYRYPIWSFIDANLFFEVGNAFGDGLEDFEFEALRPNVGLSLRTVGSRYNSLDVFVALGGTRFDADPLEIDSVSIGLGTNWGF